MSYSRKKAASSVIAPSKSSLCLFKVFDLPATDTKDDVASLIVRIVLKPFTLCKSARQGVG